MSLRARLLAVVAILTAVALAAAGAVTYAALRQFLLSRVDRSLTGGAETVASTVEGRGRLDEDALVGLVSTTPGVYVGVTGRGVAGVRWTAIGTPEGRRPPPPPRLPPLATVDSPPATVTAVSGGVRYRAYVEPLRGGGALVLAAPLDDVTATLDRLLVVELAVSAVVMAAVLGLGAWLVRVGLRPLSRIEATAASIAGGDLSRRVPEASPRTEVGRLGATLNGMLERIEEAFDEREASERTLRRFVADASHELRTPLAAARA